MTTIDNFQVTQRENIFENSLRNQIVVEEVTSSMNSTTVLA